MHGRIRGTFLGLVVIAALAPASAHAATEIIEIDPPANPNACVLFTDINDHNELSGVEYLNSCNDPPFKAVRWSNGVYQLLEPPSNCTNSIGRAINNDGMVVGNATGCTGDEGQAQAWAPGSTSATGLGALVAGQASLAMALNDAGNAVGFSCCGGGRMAVLFSAGAVTQLEQYMAPGPGAWLAAAIDINRFGTILAWPRTITYKTPYLWVNGVFTNLDCLQVAPSPFGLLINQSGDLNDSNVVVAQSATDVNVAAEWRNGQCTDLGPGQVVDTNNYDIALGVSGGKGVVWRAPGAPLTLDSFLPAQSPYSNITGTSINEQNWILGHATREGVSHQVLYRPEDLVPPQCSDGVDNDNDAKIDFPADPGCEGTDDESESPDPGEPPPGDTPPNTKISKAEINSDAGTATFSFGAPAKADSGFECALAKKKKKLKFKGCVSPKKYKHLKDGKYTFAVRDFNASGTDSTPAKKKFKIG